MKALLKKDVYLLWRSAPIAIFGILFISLFCALGRQSNLALLCELGFLTAGMVEVILLVEEANCWHIMQDTMPMSRAKIVCEKYLFFGLAGLLVTAGQALLNTGYSLIVQRHVEAGNILFLPMIIFSAAMLWGSVVLPFFFRFGSILGRSVYQVALVIGVISAMVLSKSVKIPDHIPVHPVVLMSGLLGAGVLFWGLSCLLSIRFYRRRDLQ